MTNLSRQILVLYALIGSVVLLLSGCATSPDKVLTPDIAGDYVMDPQHTSVIWALSHSGLSNYTGQFDRSSGELKFDPDQPEDSQLVVRIDAASLSTGLPDFDQTLREDARYFDVSTFPEITFVSTAIRITGENTGEITGDLTFKGVSQPVTLEVVFNGVGKSFGHPGDTLGFSATGQFRRSDFGMTHLIAFGIGDTISLRIETEFNEKQ